MFVFTKLKFIPMFPSLGNRCLAPRKDLLLVSLFTSFIPVKKKALQSWKQQIQRSCMNGFVLSGGFKEGYLPKKIVTAVVNSLTLLNENKHVLICRMQSTSIFTFVDSFYAVTRHHRYILVISEPARHHLTESRLLFTSHSTIP